MPEEALSNLSEERNLLACVIRSQDAWLRISDSITVEDFSHPINRALWTVINEMREGNVIPSPVSVTDKLPADVKDKVDKLGGWEFISKLEQIPIEPLNVEHHAKTLNNLTVLRRGRSAGETIKGLANSITSSEEFLGKVDQVVNEIPGEVGTQVTLLGSIVKDFIAKKRAHPKEIPGLTTGFPLFDTITQGLQPGRLYIVGARTGLGKSIWCLNLVKHLAVDLELPVLYISTEQSQEDEIQRLLSIVAEVPERYIGNGTFIDMNEYPERVDWAEKVVEKAPIHFVHDPMFTPEKLYRTIKKFVLIEGVKAVFFDYIRIPVSKLTANDKWAIAGDLAYSLKALASSLDIPIVSAVQVNRDGSNEFKLTGEIDESYFALSDEIARAASVAMILRKLNKVERDENPDYESKRILTFAKNRHGPQNAKLLFTIDDGFVRLRELKALDK